jgi:hypothetical protein
MTVQHVSTTSFRFSPRRVKKAGLPSTPYAKALRSLWNDVRSVEDMQRVFSRQVMQYLERNGYIVQEDGKYALTAAGVKALLACGYPPAGTNI